MHEQLYRIFLGPQITPLATRIARTGSWRCAREPGAISPRAGGEVIILWTALNIFIRILNTGTCDKTDNDYNAAGATRHEQLAVPGGSGREGWGWGGLGDKADGACGVRIACAGL